jgi:hypothetical protein
MRSANRPVQLHWRRTLVHQIFTDLFLGCENNGKSTEKNLNFLRYTDRGIFLCGYISMKEYIELRMKSLSA